MIELIHGSIFDLDPADVALLGAHHMITDPPYSEHVHANAASHGTGGRGSRKRDLEFACASQDLRLKTMAIASMCTGWCVVFSDLESAHLWRDAGDAVRAQYIRTVPWIRWSQPQLSGDRPPTGAEAINHFAIGSADADHVGSDPCLLHFARPTRKRWNGPGSLTHYSRRCLRGADKHPTEKPLDLMLDLVCYFSEPGELILDPFAGNATTLIAASLLDRDAIGFERDQGFYDRAFGRLNAPHLSGRDSLRAHEWCESVTAEASSVPTPKAADGSDVKTWERAQRRLRDVDTVLKKLKI